MTNTDTTDGGQDKDDVHDPLALHSAALIGSAAAVWIPSSGAGTQPSSPGPSTFSLRRPRACVSSLGITQILFASPCASCGSICRYW